MLHDLDAAMIRRHGVIAVGGLRLTYRTQQLAPTRWVALGALLRRAPEAGGALACAPVAGLGDSEEDALRDLVDSVPRGWLDAPGDSPRPPFPQPTVAGVQPVCDRYGAGTPH